MKKFILTIPQQDPENGLKKNVYIPEGNDLLKFEKPTAFPIIPLINAYAERGEEIKIIAIRQEYENCKKNASALENEISELAESNGFVLSGGIEYIDIPIDESVDTHIHTFQKLLDYIENNDELYSCITYGSKPIPIIVSMALRYAEAVMQNATVKCVAYGQVDRQHLDNDGEYTMRLYDVTALLVISGIVESLKDKKVKNVKDVINSIINL